MEQGFFLNVASWLIPLVFAIVFHEIAHGWVAYAFGDPTAKLAGRLSPNPVRHVDPIGTVVLPLLLAITSAPIFGWAKPVPVRAERLRNPRVQMMLVALAGPFTNFALASFTALFIGIVAPQSPFLLQMLFNFMAVNLFLGLFNLLPLPPFDGGHVVEGLLPRPLARQYRKLAPWGFPILFFLLLIVPLITNVSIVRVVVMPPFEALMRFLGVLAGF